MVRVEIRWARSATRHRISRKRSEYVVRNPLTLFVQPAPADSRLKNDRLVYLGADADGVLLEVMAVETDEALVIIHAMRIRDRYREYLDSPGDEDDG
jgi:hypothetical protein